MARAEARDFAAHHHHELAERGIRLPQHGSACKHPVVAGALCVEMFGYGFGFVGVILLMMQEIAPGNYQAAHYAFANSLMNLGLVIPGAISGYVQKWMGYRMFFVWVLISAIPALVMARFVPIGRSKADATQPSRAFVEADSSAEIEAIWL